MNPERDRLGRVQEAAVAAEQLQGRQVGDAGVGITGGDRAAPDVTANFDQRRADPHLATHPGVLGVGPEPVELDQHPEPPRVHRLAAGRLGEARDRALRDQRDRAVTAAIDRALTGRDQLQALAEMSESASDQGPASTRASRAREKNLVVIDRPRPTSPVAETPSGKVSVRTPGSTS